MIMENKTDKAKRRGGKLVTDASIQDLFDKLSAPSEEVQLNFCYILALMMLSRKLLVRVDSFQDKMVGKSYLIFEHAKTKKRYIVQDPHLSKEHMMLVQKEVEGTHGEEMRKKGKNYEYEQER